MQIVVACGGTGGHAFPGLAVAEELRRRGHEVTVWDSGRDVESSVMRSWTGNIFSTGAKQLALKNAPAILHSLLRCRKEMKKARPDVLLAMGSYSSLPPVLAAKAYGVPVVLHEANTVPGKAVEFLSRYAKTVAISFDMTADYLRGVKTVRTGLPVRAGIAKGRRFDFIPADALVVLAQPVNTPAARAAQIMLTAKNSLLPFRKRQSSFRWKSFSSLVFVFFSVSMVILRQKGGRRACLPFLWYFTAAKMSIA